MARKKETWKGLTRTGGTEALNNSFAHAKQRNESCIQLKENNRREVLAAYFRIKLEYSKTRRHQPLLTLCPKGLAYGRSFKSKINFILPWKTNKFGFGFVCGALFYLFIF